MNTSQDEMALRAKLATKMLKVMEAVTRIVKGGNNVTQDYKYVTETDTVAAVRKAMIRAGVMLTMSATASDYQHEYTTKNGSKFRVVRVNVKVNWIDTETGYTMTEYFDGEGSDSGDKALYKAITGAEKYVLLKTFLIATGDDPEREDKATDPKPAGKAPETPQGGKVNASQVKMIHKKCDAAKVNYRDVCAHFKVDHLEDIPFAKLNEALAAISDGKIKTT